MPKLVVCSHNLKSNALRDLANELSSRLGYKVWRVKPKLVRDRHAVRFLPGINKVDQFKAFHGKNVAAPAYVTSLDGVRSLESKLVVIRALIDSSEGRGITICPREQVQIVAPLYTEYIAKKKEFRVHVLDNKVIDVQEKRRRKDGNVEKEYQVRNTANGYVFCRDNVLPPPDCFSVALDAVTSLGRTYGAVDIIWNEKRNKCYVLEVNSRPGMQGTTLTKYANAIIKGLPGNVINPPKRIPRLRRADGLRKVRRG